jgi:murein DD-endopeptidase MepM/ murein hydrolase activator NlpD
MPVARAVVQGQRSRTHDGYGSGQFGVSRDGGIRTHRGLDIIAKPSALIFSPIRGTIVREAFPYKGDTSVRGVVVKGTNEWTDYEVKIFYAEGLLSGDVLPGQHIAFAQDLSKRYPGITNHVHVEVRRGGKVIDPQDIFAQCF